MKRSFIAISVDVYKRQVQPFLLPLDFELGDSQVFFGAATLTALYIGIPVLQKNGKPVLKKSYSILQDGLSGIVQQGLGCPLLAPADLRCV